MSLYFLARKRARARARSVATGGLFGDWNVTCTLHAISIDAMPCLMWTHDGSHSTGSASVDVEPFMVEKYADPLARLPSKLCEFGHGHGHAYGEDKHRDRL